MFASIKMKNTFGQKSMTDYAMSVFTEGSDVHIRFRALKGYEGTVTEVSFDIPSDVANKLARALQNAPKATSDNQIREVIHEEE